MEPHNHRVNAAERAIQTAKNHLISGLCITDPEFPLQHWDSLIEQCQITLNMLRTSRTNPKLSAYQALEGTFDFNATPLAPPGTRALIYNPPSVRASWAPRGEDAWYIGPAMNHYRCFKFFVIDSNAYRISASAKFYPKNCRMPSTSNAQLLQEAAENLIQALQNPHPAIPINTNTRHTKALHQLTNLFKNISTEYNNSEGENKMIH